MRRLWVLFLLSVIVEASGSRASAQLPLRFDEQLVMDGFTYSCGIATADLDGDGDLDITSADALPNNDLYWFENDGQGRFQKHFIQKDDPERLERHAIGDVDKDGHLDVVIVKNLVGDLLWFRNSGKPADGKLWKRHVINSKKIPGAYDVALGDYDGVGGDARQGAGIVVGARRGIRPARHATRRQCLRLRALLPGSELSIFHRTN